MTEEQTEKMIRWVETTSTIMSKIISTLDSVNKKIESLEDKVGFLEDLVAHQEART